MRFLVIVSLFCATYAKQWPFHVQPTAAWSGHVLVRVNVAAVEDLTRLKQTLDAVHADIWSVDVEHGHTMDVWVNRDALKRLTAVVPSDALRIEAAGEQIQAQVEAEALRLSKSAAVAIDYRDDQQWFKEYHRFDDIRAWYGSLAERFPNLVTLVPSIGKTHEGRDIFALHLTQSNATVTQKPQVYIQGQIHAREWISGATVQFIVHHFVTQYGKDDEITALLNRVELVVVPVVNPDGYEYSWTGMGNRLWRKNRRNNGGSFGVDLNRNWNVNWDDDRGSSRSPFSETYKGPSVASEPETQAISQYFLKNTRIVGAIDVHSFSQLVLRPLGWTKQPYAHESQHKQLGDKIRDLIYSVHGKSYTSIAAIDLYATSGTASDWFYAGKEVSGSFGHHVYGYTIELRPKSAFGGQGFILPPSEIIPTGEEIVAAFRYFVRHVVENPLN